MKAFAALVALAAVSLTACGDEADKAAPGITLSDGWCRATPRDASAAFCFITVANGGPSQDRLVGGHSSAADQVQISETYADGNIMRMRPVDSLTIPANTTVTMAPGGNLVRLDGLTSPMVVGSTVAVTLKFDEAGEKQVLFPVRIEAEAASDQDG